MAPLTPAQDKAVRLLYTEAKRTTWPIEMRDFAPRQVAELLWPDSPAWNQCTRGRNNRSGAMGGTMPMNAAKILWRLRDLGMTQTHSMGWSLTNAAVRYVEGEH